jgi:protease-4
VQLSSGKYKDAGDPDRPLTEEERQLFLRDIKIVHKNFIEDVAVNRDIPVADVQKIADGSSVLGDRAKELRLIDEIGGIREAEKYLESIIGEKPEVCWY